MDMNNSPRSSFVTRRAEIAVATALEDTRVVLIEGPRQAGKTTLARKFVNDQRPFMSLDDPVILANAKSDPVGFIRNLQGAVIDEIQRAPELMLVIKQSVDTNTAPGRFLLTGSANVMSLPTIGDSLAGRIEIVQLFPFAQSELAGRSGEAIDRFFSDAPLPLGEPVIGQELADIVARGGYPEAIGRKDARRRAKWFTDYLTLILDRDVRDIATIDQLEKLPLLVRLLAEQSGQLSNQANIASALQISRATVGRYIETLERMFLIDTLQPWFSNRMSRLIKTPKHQFLDSGLLSALRQFSPVPPQADPTRFGPLLESFVGAELRKLIGWSEARVTLSHFRTKDGDEVDFVLEDQKGRIVGIEVKATATLRRGDFSGLRKLEAATGDKFVRGLVLHDHDSLRPFSEKISGVPVSVLWSA
jgi:uncharacterized protein